jgi:hypothetical protein
VTKFHGVKGRSTLPSINTTEIKVSKKKEKRRGKRTLLKLQYYRNRDKMLAIRLFLYSGHCFFLFTEEITKKLKAIQFPQLGCEQCIGIATFGGAHSIAYQNRLRLSEG